MLFILVQILIFAVSVLINGPMNSIPLYIKMLLSINCLIYAGYLWLNNINISYRKTIFIGMLCCSVGDFLFTKTIPCQNNYILGGTAFYLAHIFYIISYVKIMKQHNLNIINKRLAAGFGIYIIGIFIIWFIFMYSANKSPISYGVLVYGIMLGTMAAFAFALTCIDKRYCITAIGAALFVISDLTIGITGLGKIIVPYRDVIVWFTYIAALMCIISVPDTTTIISNSAKLKLDC